MLLNALDVMNSDVGVVRMWSANHYDTSRPRHKQRLAVTGLERAVVWLQGPPRDLYDGVIEFMTRWLSQEVWQRWNKLVPRKPLSPFKPKTTTRLATKI